MTPRVKLYADQEAAKAGVSPQEVLAGSCRRRAVRARLKVAVRLRNDGFNCALIASWIGVSRNTVFRYMNGIEPLKGLRS